jgi:hypothetical protein
MSWNYDLTVLATDKMTQVRYLIGDTVPTEPLVQDEEIVFMLAQRPSIYAAAAQCCRALAARLSREADTVDKDLHTLMSARAKAFRAMSNDYEVKAVTRSGAQVFAGGTSYSDVAQRQGDLNRIPSQFALGEDTNFTPVSPVGGESTPLPSAQAGNFNG